MRNVYEILEELNNHPDYIGGQNWTKQNVMGTIGDHMKDYIEGEYIEDEYIEDALLNELIDNCDWNDYIKCFNEYKLDNIVYYTENDGSILDWLDFDSDKFIEPIITMYNREIKLRELI
jgi:hypothetical protein